MAKTPVSILQERSAKECLQPPQYDLVFNRSDGVNPEFKYKVTFASVEAFGSGRSKKEAKHNAAESALAKLAVLDSVSCSNLPKEPVLSPYSNKVERNYVGELLSYCSEGQLHDPKFCEAGAEGPSHAPLFTMKCTVSKFEETAEALTKKQAKQLVAKKMLHRLHACLKDVIQSKPAEEPKKQATKCVDSTQYEEDLESVFKKLHDNPRIPVTMNPNSISELHYALKKSYPEMPEPLKNFHEKKISESWNPITTAEQVAEIMNVLLNICIYKQGNSSPSSPEWVARATMDTNPKTEVMCYGVNQNEAKRKTALELLDYLYLMLK